MVQVLGLADYARIKSLAAELRDQTMALAVLDGTRPGIVLANDRLDPSTIFIAAPEGSFAWIYLAGYTDGSTFHQDLNRWLFDDHGLGADVAFSFLVCDNASWDPALSVILQPRVVIPDRRLLYMCTQCPESWRSVIPDGYSIRSLDQDLFDSDVGIPEKVSQWFDNNFGLRAVFLDRGFGAVAVHDDHVIAWCLTDSVVGDRADIGVETDEAHQKRGLAYCTTCMTLEQGFDRGFQEIGWHCHLINVPSVKTAEKAGFQLHHEYPVYAVHFDVEKHADLANVIGGEIIDQASACLGDGDYLEAHLLFERALEFSTHDKFGVYLLAARAAAGCTEPDVAFARLAIATTLGWSPTTDKRAYTELTQLHSDPRWLDLAA